MVFSKLYRNLFLLLLFLLLIAITFHSQSNASEKTLQLTPEEKIWIKNNTKIKIGISPFQQPLLFKNKVEGIIPDYIQLVGEKLGIDLEVKPFSSKKDLLQSLSKSQIDGFISINDPTEQKNTHLLQSNQFLDFPMVLASLEKKPIFSGLNDHALKKLAMPNHSPLLQKIKSEYSEVKVVPVNNCSDGLNALLNKKADGFVCNPNVIAYLLRTLEVSGVVISSITPYNLGFAIQIPQDNLIVHSILNKAIQSISNQEIQLIKQKWQVVKIQQYPDYTIYIQIGLATIFLTFLILLWVIWWNRRLKKEIRLKKEAEQKYKILLDNVPGMVYRAKNEPDWPMVEVNEAAFELTGYTRDEFMSHSVLFNDVIVEEYRQSIWELVQDALKENRNYIIEYEIQTKSGEKKWVWERGAPYYSPEGELLWLEGLIIDSTDIKTVALKLEDEEIKYRTVYNSTTDALLIQDPNTGAILDVNSTGEKITGYTKQEILSMTIWELSPGGEYNQENVIKNINDAKKGTLKQPFEWKCLKKDGSIIDLEVSLQFIKLNNQATILAIAKDVTLKKQQEDELRKKEDLMIAQSRHAAMGEMISMIAHQWRQPLSTISMIANNIMVDIDLDIVDNKIFYKHAQDILSQIEELSKTIDDFKNFFKPTKVVENILPQDIINETFKVVGKSLENNEITVITQFNSDKKIDTYSRELMQVFINLIKNAKEILVEKNISDKEIKIKIEHDQKNVTIKVCDNAGGIPDNIIDKIFDPYFSTKDEKNGTGLGLYMSKTIIEKHLQGKLEAYNENGGACFKIELPFQIKKDTVK